MVDELDDLTKYLLQNGYVHCNDCNEILRKGDWNQHFKREHNKIRRISYSDEGK